MRVLAKTPEMLPVLKEAGVVDSGGQGLVEVLKGVLTMHSLAKRSITRLNRLKAPKKLPALVKSAATDRSRDSNSVTVPNLSSCSKKSIHRRRSRSSKDFWSPSVIPSLLVSDEDDCQGHMYIQTTLVKAISRSTRPYGSLTRIKIDNMREEHQEKLIKDAAKVAEQQKFEEEET